MAERNFRELLEARWDEGKFVCVGLDSEYVKIPKIPDLGGPNERMNIFNAKIVDATKDLVCAYKLNVAFYEARGIPGAFALESAIQHIHEVARGVPVILDAKRGDIGNTNNGYVQAAFDNLGADAITVHPYLGAEALKPFLDRADKGIFILCRTSNPGSGCLQDLDIAGKPLYERLAGWVHSSWNANGNCGLVVGATYPDELGRVRRNVGEMPILIPGIGAQGGDLEKTIAAGKSPRGRGMIINSSRGIIFASNGPDFAEAARREAQKLHDQITACLAKGD